MAYGQWGEDPYRQGNYNYYSQNNYAAGRKRYGPTGRDNPTSGPVDKSGYRERDAGAQAKRNAMLRKLKANQRGAYASSDALKPTAPSIPPLNQILGWYS